MNISALLGIIAALTVFVAALFATTDNIKLFVDLHAILIVMGGTLAATMISFPIKTIFSLFKVFLNKVLGKYATAHTTAIQEAVELANGYRQDEEFLKKQAPQIKTYFLKEAVELMIQGGIPDHELDYILEKRADVMSRRHEKESSVFKTIGKFPPAFGLMGTTLGMIAVLQKLGSPDSFSGMGPAMAVGLVATLYGIAMTNLIFIPIGENLHKLNQEEDLLREIVINAVKLLRRREHPILVEQHLLSYLLPKERSTYKGKAA